MKGIWWIDLNSEDLKEAQDLLTEESADTIDDLGFGSVRDLISDLLFPATSTIMTEVRYLVFVPALFREIERRELKGELARHELENLEEQLRDALVAGGEKNRVIGYDSKRPQRIPTDIYWAALRTLGIHCFNGSRFRYLNSMNTSYYQRISDWKKGAKRERDFDDRGPDSFLANYFPTEWNEVSETTTFQLTPGETEWIKLRYESSEMTNKSFFVHLLRNQSQLPDGKGGLPDFWHFYSSDNMPDYGSLIHDARCYSYLQLGSQHMYNLLLKPTDEYVEAFETWRKEDEFRILKDWDYIKFRRVLSANRIGEQTLKFHSFWLQAVLEEISIVELRNRIEPMFKQRERTKKGLARSRLYNPERAANYHYPTDRYRFRWDIAHRFLIRLQEGEKNS